MILSVLWLIACSRYMIRNSLAEVIWNSLYVFCRSVAGRLVELSTGERCNTIKVNSISSSRGEEAIFIMGHFQSWWMFGWLPLNQCVFCDHMTQMCQCVCLIELFWTYHPLWSSIVICRFRIFSVSHFGGVNITGFAVVIKITSHMHDIHNVL